MKRFLPIFIAIFLIALTGLVSVHGKVYGDSDLDIDEVFYHLDSEVCEICISGWVKFNNRYMDMIELKEYAEGLMQNLKASSYTTLQSQDSDLVRQLKLGLDFDYTDVSMTLTLNNGLYRSSGEKLNNYETYIVINVVLFENDINEADILYKAIEGFLSQLASTHHIYKTYVATIPGDIGIRKMNRVCKKIFREFDGKVIERISFDNMVSKTGYTDNIDDYLIIQDKKINLNVALRYNEYENKTIIWIGMPIISTTY